MTAADILAPLLGITVPLIAIGGLIWRLSSKITGIDQRSTQAASDAHDAKESSARTSAAVGELRQELARDYVRSGPFEARMQRLEERIDDLPGRVAALLHTAPPPAPRVRRTRRASGDAS